MLKLAVPIAPEAKVWICGEDIPEQYGFTKRQITGWRDKGCPALPKRKKLDRCWGCGKDSLRRVRYYRRSELDAIKKKLAEAAESDYVEPKVIRDEFKLSKAVLDDWRADHCHWLTDAENQDLCKQLSRVPVGKGPREVVHFSRRLVKLALERRREWRGYSKVFAEFSGKRVFVLSFAACAADIALSDLRWLKVKAGGSAKARELRSAGIRLTKITSPRRSGPRKVNALSEDQFRSLMEHEDKDWKAALKAVGVGDGQVAAIEAGPAAPIKQRGGWNKGRCAHDPKITKRVVQASQNADYPRRGKYKLIGDAFNISAQEVERILDTHRKNLLRANQSDSI